MNDTGVTRGMVTNKIKKLIKNALKNININKTLKTYQNEIISSYFVFLKY